MKRSAPTINPLLYPATVRFADDAIEDVAAAVTSALDAGGIHVSRGDRVAVASGSRGIASIDVIVRAAVAWLRDNGAQPLLLVGEDEVMIPAIDAFVTAVESTDRGTVVRVRSIPGLLEVNRPVDAPDPEP